MIPRPSAQSRGRVRVKITRNVFDDGRTAPVGGTPLSQPRVCVYGDKYMRGNRRVVKFDRCTEGAKRAQRESKIYSTEKKLVILLKETAPYALSTTKART